jgi:hypothetical protein
MNCVDRLSIHDGLNPESQHTHSLSNGDDCNCAGPAGGAAKQ